MSEQAGRYTRSASGMVGAMLVLLAVIVAFVLFRDLNRNDLVTKVEPVDYRSVAAAAQEQAGFDLQVPARLPEGWRATSARFSPDGAGSWHLGLLTKRSEYVGLEQSSSSAQDMLRTYVDPEPTREEPVTVEGRTWQSWSDAGGDVAFVRSAGAVTTLVVGTPDREVLVDYIATLR